MDLWPPGPYKRQGVEQGEDPAVVDSALNLAHAVQRNGFPAVISLRHLADHVQVPYQFLRDVVGRRNNPYRSFPIKKKPTGYRVICVPAPHLMRVQKWIHQFILYHIKPHHCSYAYANACSPIRCAQMHAGCKWLVKVDIRRFFESMDEIQAYRIFRKCGYSALVSFELARLATRVPDIGYTREAARWALRKAETYKISAYRSAHLGHLPQGAPTSPMLANLAMIDFDNEAEKIATDSGLTYTRYSDDLAFSTTDVSFNRSKAQKLIRRIYGLVNAFKLEARTSKTVISPPGSRRIVLGLTVNDERPRLTRETRRALELHVHFVAKLGYSVHAREREFDSAQGCYHYLRGLIAYACQVEPDFGGRMRDEISIVPPPF